MKQKSVVYSKNYINRLNQDIIQFFPEVRSVSSTDKTTFQDVARMVMLDRYAQKDLKLITLATGDLVVVMIKNLKRFAVRGLGYIHRIYEDKVAIKLEKQYLSQVPPEDIQPDQTIIRPKNLIEKPLEIYYEQIAWRVAKALASVEKVPALQKKWTDKFYQQIVSKQVVPAGRVLYGAGSRSKVTLFNCFVLPMITDSRAGIARHRGELMEIMARGGGVGTNGSTLRPRGVVAKKVGGRSSGAVSWLNDLSMLTHLVEQGGSRRGAQMIMLADWHPDIIEFIIAKIQQPNILRWMLKNLTNPLITNLVKKKLKFIALNEKMRQTYLQILKTPQEFPQEIVTKAKQRLEDGGKWIVVNPDFLTGANISIMISDDFMYAVKNNLEWKLSFPDIDNYNEQEKADYDALWSEIGDVRDWASKGFRVKTYYTLAAKELWDLICVCATYSGEPGIFFIDRVNAYTNARAYGMKVIASNPCAEQPLTAYAVCNLASLNLSQFVDRTNKKILDQKLITAVQTCVRMQDNVIDLSEPFLEPNTKQALGERRVGLGVMGLSDLLIWAGIKYGSDESITVVDRLFRLIARAAYRTSSNLALEKGSFPFLKKNTDFLKTGFIQNMDDDIRQLILKQGIRNSHLLTVAPTGTTSTLMNVANGLEPYFAFQYYRSGRLGKFMAINAPIVEEWKAVHHWPKEKPLPDFFVTAQNLNPSDHVHMQCVIQRWIDSSISKTVNAPKGYTVQQVENIYMDLYNQGAKTGTVYVDGSRDEQVLSLAPIENQFDDHQVTTTVTAPNQPEEVEVESELITPHLATKEPCYVCNVGELEVTAGCHTCNRCGAQQKCSL